ncbi:hypothetical protein COUCH_33320 [Couchioplanes caeruleus]|uniref:Rv0361 family membrane protein n=1 Tax=Couchioplanes caeruleus TaxID=56438 RepID=UPI0020C0C2B5|nr:hypothetical protein [Couchioplanes caeruleus]UQU63816.1 hypothetical protein COUCH_33320 [Couchioplanes caeruleus]
MTTPAAPPRKRKKWPFVLGTVLVLVFLTCALGIGRLYFRLKHVTDLDKAAEKATSAFIDDYRDGLSPAGYDGLCAEAKEEFAREDLAGPAKGKAITGYRITSTNVDYDRRRATVGAQIRRADGSTADEVYVLDEVDDEWRMCVFPT